MIGRDDEIALLREQGAADRSRLVVVYGRRRIGKTFLVREAFDYRFTFTFTGVERATLSEQLSQFHQALVEQGLPECPVPRSWIDAFGLLKKLLSASKDERKIVFIDELPWMDTPKSKFVMWFESFWNGWCSARKDVVFVICGSATSWIVKKVFRNRGGLYNRVTEKIHLAPFTLCECRELCRSLGVSLSDADIAELYMIFGGVPYYWTFLERGKSVAQNVDALLFARNGKLRNEFGEVFQSLFGDNAGYLKVVRALAGKGCGMTYGEILSSTGLSKGGVSLRILDALEQSGFVRRYTAYGKKKQDAQYQLVDGFTLFHLKFLDGESNLDAHFWSHATIGSALNTWRGLAFERVCLLHVPQIKKALGISGVLTSVYSWRHVPDDTYASGAQIDLMIERADRIVNICEIKYAREEFTIDKEYDRKLRNKIGTFRGVTKTKCAVHITMITANGLAHNGYWGIAQSEISLDDLFADADV